MIYYVTNYVIWWQEFYLSTAFAAINVIFFSSSVFTRVEGMRNIDTVIFYPIYKTLWPIIVTAISILFFHETLESREVLGIILWIMVPLLLINKKEGHIQKNLFIWLVFVCASSILSGIGTIGTKWIMFYDLNIPVFLMMSLFLGMLTTSIMNLIYNRKNKKKYNKKWALSFSFATSIIHLSTFIFFTLAMSGNLAVVFTINSFSILIPIILSIIFYQEHWNTRKAIVILLSIISIIMFI